MAQPIATLRTDRGPAVATSIPAQSGAEYVVGRAFGNGIYAPGDVVLAVPLSSDGTGHNVIYTDDAICVGLSGAYDVDAYIRIVCQNEPEGAFQAILQTGDPAGEFGGFVFYDGSYSVRSEFAFDGSEWVCFLDLSMALLVPADNGFVLLSLSNFTNETVEADYVLGCHWIMDVEVAE